MMVLVSYDVAKDDNGARRLRRVAKTCKNYGQRVQYSLFECLVDPAQFAAFRRQLEKQIDPSLDSLRYYFLGANWQQRVQHVGAKPSVNPEGTIIA
jgi:CRISPR-associated protein Cas2